MKGIKLGQFIQKLKEQQSEMSEVMESMRQHLFGMKDACNNDCFDFLTEPLSTQLNCFGTIESNFANEVMTLEQVKESYLAQDRKIASDINVSLENNK